MNFTDRVTPVIAGPSAPFAIRKKWLGGWVLLALLLTLCGARADKQDDDYLRILTTIDLADTLNETGKISAAHAKYQEAQWALAKFQRAYPNWNSRTVKFRVKYVAEKVTATAAKAADAENFAPVTPPAAPPEAPPAAANANAAADGNEPAPLIQETPAAASVAALPTVTLLEPGSEPRVALRLNPQAGDKQTLVMTTKMAMTMALGDQPMPAVAMPPMLLTMDFAVQDIASNGDITYGLVFSDATVAADTNASPLVMAAMQPVLASMKGLTGSGQMSARGLVKSVEMKSSAADPQMAQTMDQLKESLSAAATPLPEEAVGPGAKWESVTQIKSQGLTIDQTVVYELVTVISNRLTLRSTITQSAAGQKVENPAMPGLKVDLTRLTGSGTGSSTFDLAHIMPLTAAFAAKTEMVMSVPMGPQAQSMTMKMDQNVSLETK